MEEPETTSLHSRKELRKQKLMEYLKAKGKFKEPNLKSNRQNAFQMTKVTTPSLKVMGKENKSLEQFGNKHKKSHVTVQSTVGPAKNILGVCNKSILLPGCHSAKPPRAGNKPSDSAISKTAVQTLSRNHGSRSASTLSCPVSSRISLGPLVKTKTGLVPAVTQPSQIRRHTSVRETGATKSVVSKFTPRNLASVTASKSSGSLASKKTLAPVFKSSDEEKKTVSSLTGAKMKVQGQSRTSSNLQLEKSTRPSKSQQSNPQKSTSSLYKCTNAADGHKEKLAKCNKPTTQPTNWSKNPKPEPKVGKSGHLHTVPSQTSRTGAAHRAKDQQAQKTRMSSKNDDAVGRGSANVRPERRTAVAKPAGTVSFTDRAAGSRGKVPDAPIPQTDGKKRTAAQAERMRKLQEWREAKGISYKRPPMPVKAQAQRPAPKWRSFWPTMKDEDEAHSLICAVDRSLADCIQLLREGCPPEQVKAVLTRLPAVSHKFVKYWICRARLMEREGNLDVLPLFEEAVSIVLEPVDELRAVVFEILKRKDEEQAAEDEEEEEGDLPAVERTPECNKDPVKTPKPVRALICGEKGESSVVKYKITATPGCPPSQQKEPARVNGQEVRFFTPVRRSVRIERASLRYPASLQEHDLCVASYSDLICMEDKERIEEELVGETSPPTNSSPMYVYRENDALKDKVLVKLVWEEDAQV